MEEKKIFFAKDVSEFLGINKTSATKLFHRPDFPGITNLGRFKVFYTDFIDWVHSQKLAV